MKSLEEIESDVDRSTGFQVLGLARNFVEFITTTFSHFVNIQRGKEIDFR